MISIIFFPPLDIDKGYYKKIITGLCEKNMFEIYVINRPVDLIIDTLNGFKRLRKWFAFVKKKSNVDIKILFPFVFLNEVIHESLFSWGNINMKILILQVKRLIKKEGINPENLILWSFSPFHWKIMKEIPAKRKIYGVEDEYCYDIKDRLKKNIYKAETKMVYHSDEIICGSEKLVEKFQSIVSESKKVHLISNVADNRSFEKSNVIEFSPWDIIPDPKIVIFGEIRYQTNFTLIEKLAIKVRQASIVFIGKVHSSKYYNDYLKPMFNKYQNIHHLGFISRDNVIYCLRSAAVGLYPAKKCYYSIYANPIRIYEYAAAGIPVVASNISCETDYPKSIEVVHDDSDFVKTVEKILEKGISMNDKEDLIQFAKKHSANEIMKKYASVFRTAITE